MTEKDLEMIKAADAVHIKRYKEIMAMSTEAYKQAMRNPVLAEEINSVVEREETRKLAAASSKQFRETYSMSNPEFVAIVEMVMKSGAKPTFQAFVNAMVQLKEMQQQLKDYDDPARQPVKLPSKSEVENMSAEEYRRWSATSPEFRAREENRSAAI